MIAGKGPGNGGPNAVSGHSVAHATAGCAVLSDLEPNSHRGDAFVGFRTNIVF